MTKRKQLSDTRHVPRTLAEADELLRDIALATVQANKAAAMADAAIAGIKAKYTATIAEDKAAISVMEALLTEYILQHRDQFVRPKSRKTIFGAYGLRTATKLEVTDPEQVYRYALDAGKPSLCSVSYKVSNRACAQMLKEGTQIPGVSLSTGEIAGYTLNLDVVDNTKGGTQ